MHIFGFQVRTWVLSVQDLTNMALHEQVDP